MQVSKMIKEAIEQKGFRTLKQASMALGVSPELLRITMQKTHVPKDKTLVRIAERLGLDSAALILAAHQQTVPVDTKHFFLSPLKATFTSRKRIFPLSEEQCNYLSAILSNQEIQIIRKYRQVTEEGKTQITGYVDYMFGTKRIKAEAEENAAQPFAPFSSPRA